ncbi:MAG: ERCC4 domain-containing protein, partial [Halobacteriaceae archaeon]
EVMTEDDARVEPYSFTTEVDWETVTLPDEIIDIRDLLNDVIEDRLADLKDLGVVSSTSPDLSQSDLNQIRGRLQSLIDQDESKGYEGMSLHAELMKLRRAVELVETQSVESLSRYFERQRNSARSSGASKASQRLVSEPKVKRAMQLAEKFDDLHPKFRQTRMLLASALGIGGGDRVIVFTESRDTAETLVDFLGDHFEARKFVGQGNKQGSSGMTQKEQKKTLDEFRNGEFEVLVSTSVAEEGLDVPDVDLVLFYEPVPTAIRSIQRRGRTGRQSKGKVVVLLAEDTRDEAYFWISRRREQEMEEELRNLKESIDSISEELDHQQSLDAMSDEDTQRKIGTYSSNGSPDGHHEVEEKDIHSNGEDSQSSETNPTIEAEESVEIVIDQRELDSNIPRKLSKQDNLDTRLETLEVGDYILSDRVVVERKTTEDFVDSLIEGERSVFEQIGDMARHYQRPVMILEGDKPFDQRNIHPNAILGALASVAIDYGASVLRTADEQGTSDLLSIIAEREQISDDREVSVHGSKTSKTLSEQQEYVISSIADIGPVT